MKLNKYIIINLSFLVFNSILFGQDKTIDSLKQVIKKAKHDTTVVTSIISIGDLFYNTTPDSAFVYNQKAIKIVEKNLSKNNLLKSEQNTFEKLQAIIYNNIGTFYFEQGFINKAKPNYQKSLTIRLKLGDKNAIAESYNNMADMYKLDSVSKAFDCYFKALKLRQETNYLYGIGETCNNIGFLYKEQGNIILALQYYEKSLAIHEKINDKQRTSISLNNIALLYRQQDNPDKALAYYKRSLDLKRQIGDLRGQASTLNNIAFIAFKNNLPDSALKNYYTSIAIYQKLNLTRDIGFTFNKIANLYSKLKKSDSTLKYYNLSIKLLEKTDDLDSYSFVLNNMANFYFENENIQLALELNKKSSSISNKLGYPQNIKESSELAYKIYKKLGKLKLAFENYELYIKMRDSLSNQDTRKASIKSQLKYEYEKKAAADSVRVAEEKKVTTLKLKQEKLQRYYLYGGLGIVGLFALFMVNRFRVTSKQKKLIEQQKTLVEEQKLLVDEKQKEILDSIRYAKRIQQAQLPTHMYMSKHLKKTTNLVL